MLTTSWHPSTWFLSTQLLGVHLLLLVVHFQLALQEVCCLRWTNGMLILFHLFTGGIRYLVLGCAYQLSYHASTFPENDCSILLPADWRLVQQGQDDHGQGWCGSSRLPQRTSLLQKKTRHCRTMNLLSPSANQHALSCTPSTKDKILCATAVGSRRNLCVGFNSSHSGGHLLSGDRGEQLVVKATLSAISKLILGKRNYVFLRDCSTCTWQPAHDGPRHRGISQQSQFFHCEGKHLDTQGNKGTTCA